MDNAVVEGQFDDAPEPLDVPAASARHYHAKNYHGEAFDETFPVVKAQSLFPTTRLDCNGWGQFDDAPELPHPTDEHKLLALDPSNGSDNSRNRNQQCEPFTTTLHVSISPSNQTDGVRHSSITIDGLTEKAVLDGEYRRRLVHQKRTPATELKPLATNPAMHGSDECQLSRKIVSSFSVETKNSKSPDAIDGFVASETIIQEDIEHQFPIDDKGVTAKDVLFGRGGKTNTHSGNVYYRNLVSKYRIGYQTAKKNNKSALARNLVHFVRSQHGRFLKKSCCDDLWYEVGDEKAIAKTGQALREGMAALIRSSFQGQTSGDSNENEHKVLRQNTEVQRFEQDVTGQKRKRR